VPRERVAFGPCEERRVGEQLDLAYRHLRSLAESVRPDMVFSPSSIDWHPDHRAVAAVVGRLLDEGLLACPVLEYPVWFFSALTWTLPAGHTPWTSPDELTPRVVIDAFRKPALAALTLETVRVSTAGYLARKRTALGAHRSQLENLTGESTWLTLSPEWLRNFFAEYEIFFPLARGRSLNG
jgi:LmbE family N-acetylglucosaminyl deacetylase